jgi:hypothetical protein
MHMAQFMRLTIAAHAILVEREQEDDLIRRLDALAG